MRHPVDPEEEDGYGSSWRRERDGERYHTRAGIPRLLVISGLALTLQAVLVLATGSVLLFLLQFPVANLALCVLFARTAPTGKPLVAQLATEVIALRQRIPALTASSAA